jgi:DNA polymerase-3 subunit delta'
MWSNIIGQEFVKKSLTHLMLNDTIPHGLIFFGDEGFGKDAIAIRFASLITEKSTTNDNFTEKINIKYITALPRGKNETDSDGPLDKISGTEFEKIKNELLKKGLNPYHKIDIPNANDIKINSIRDIQRYLSLKPNSFQKRVIIISNAELMNETSQNALLKNLEEPPDNTFFILNTNNINSLRETIRSRCQEFQFAPLPEVEIEEILQYYFAKTNEETNVVSRISEGSYTKALELIETDVSFLLEKTISILRFGLAGKYYSCLKEINDIVKKEEKEFQLVISFIIYWLYELSLSRDQFVPYYFTKYRDTIEKFNSKYGHIYLADVIKDCEDLLYRVRNTNVNLNILKFRLVMLLSSIIKIK